MSTSQDSISGLVQAYLRTQGLSQEVLAARLGIGQSALSRKLLGKRAWSLVDIDRLEEAGVLRIEVCAA